MGSNGSSASKHHFICFRCNRVIEPGDRMHTVSAFIETPDEDGSVGVLAADAISALCGGCAAILLTEAILGEKLVMPPAATDENVRSASSEAVPGATSGRARANILVSSISDNGKEEGALEVHCSQKGFCLTLQCPDGISKAASQLFTWKQIAQLLIAADPDMFGRLDEPLHKVFPKTLNRLGYSVPSWQA